MILKGIKKASQFLDASPQSVRHWANHGDLPARNIDGVWYFSEETLEPYRGTYGGDAILAADEPPAPVDE